MAVTPQITLTATLVDYEGNELGTAANPAYLRIALCGFGPILPSISGTANIAQVVSWPEDIPYIGTPLSISLWGNDVITPSGTYYAISVLDENHNVVQTGNTTFEGSETIDLSAISWVLPNPSIPTVTGGLVEVPYASNPNFNCALVTGPVTFDITLTGNVSSSTLSGSYPGQIVTFILRQNVTGNWTFAWPSNVNDPGIINSMASSKTVQMFIADASGQLWPVGPQTYN